MLMDSKTFVITMTLLSFLIGKSLYLILSRCVFHGDKKNSFSQKYMSILNKKYSILQIEKKIALSCAS